MTVDPITLEVIANRLDEIQRIMKHRLFRTGYSTILRESFDGSAGIVDCRGRIVGAAGMTTHTIPYAKLIEGILAAYPLADIHEGDAFISNDPYRGGVSHTPDVAVATPVFVDGELIAFCTSFGHKPDVGGLSPGSGSPASRSVFHEGILLPPVKIVEAGAANRSVFRILENNSRTPRLLVGDIRGQIGCTRIGAELMQELCRAFGTADVQSAIEQLLDGSERRLRLALAALPDGTAEAENWHDGDGVSKEPIRIHVALTKRGDELTIDFSNSADQSVGPANAVFQVVQAAAIGAVLSIVDHSIANNDGVRRPIRFVCPEGKVLNPRFPAPVNSYIPATHLVFNAVLEALGKLVPEKAVADSGLGLGAVAFGYKASRTGDNYVHYEIVETGLGGTAAGDGCAIIHPIMTFETIQPIEIVEREFPVRIRDFSIRPDAAGPGKHRGGLGYRREFELLEDAEFISRLAQRDFGARGINGGGAPALSRTIVNGGTPDERALPGLVQMSLPAGTRIAIEQSGGGGWGDPRERSVDAVLADVEDGYVTPERARADYGVAVTALPGGRYRAAARREGDD
ncbi:MAG: 5-oxoprolinase [Rhodospirillales bacterium]|nr:5-oxoprolinase [Rhodospirillales bacterium]